ncbi:MAG: thioredoxin family protein [Peptostreptococcaceae bacterium]|nr:thioredoxin family protein [Peptostreptococcaceae bacterium]
MGKGDIEKANYIVLGACCKKSTDTFENTKAALKIMGIEENVVNIGDSMEIAKYGVMQTPALVINNKVVSYGKLLKVEDVIKLIEKERII